MSMVVEVRCPVGPQKLFTKLKLGEEFGGMVEGTNLIEFTCGDCARTLSRERQLRFRVFHRFNFLGELIETKAEELWECGTAFTAEGSPLYRGRTPQDGENLPHS